MRVRPKTAIVRNYAPLAFLTLSICCQIVGVGAGLIFRNVSLKFFPMPSASLDGNGLWLVLLLAVHSLAAFGAAWWARLPRVWQLFNLLIAPAVVAHIEFELPGGILIAALLISLLIYLPTFWTRVPYYPTNRAMFQRVAELLPADGDFTFVDLGCGFSGLLVYLAKHRKNGRYLGVDISPLPLLISKLRAWLCGGRIRIVTQNFWAMDLSEFDFVYAFLSPEPMPRLWEKIEATRPRKLFVSNSFAVPGITAEQVIEIPGRQKLYLYPNKR